MTTPRKPAQDAWPGTPYDSDGWPFSRDLAVFEARRAIGQYVRTQFVDASDEWGDYRIVGYLVAAHAIEAAIQDIRADLVAEARARGLTWDQIARPLKVGVTAAQKRFGQGLTDDRLTALRVEAALADEMTRVGTHATREELENFVGTTPADRLDYVRMILDKTREDFEKLRGETVSDSQIVGLLESTKDKVPLLGALAADRELWDAVTEWVDQPADPDDSHYYAPATYLFLALRLILTGATLIAGLSRHVKPDDLETWSAEDRESASARIVDDLKSAYDCIATASNVFRRKDVLKALERPQG